jgi:hypothetical protein
MKRLFGEKVPRQMLGPAKNGEIELWDLYIPQRIVKYRKL